MICRPSGIADVLLHPRRGGFGGLQVSDAKRLKALAAENRQREKSRRRSGAGMAMHQGVGGEDRSSLYDRPCRLLREWATAAAAKGECQAGQVPLLQRGPRRLWLFVRSVGPEGQEQVVVFRRQGTHVPEAGCRLLQTSLHAEDPMGESQG